MTETHIALLSLTGRKGYLAAGLREARESVFAKEARVSVFAKAPEH